MSSTWTFGVYASVGPYGAGMGAGNAGVQVMGFANSNVGVSGGYYATGDLRVRTHNQ